MLIIMFLGLQIRGGGGNGIPPTHLLHEDAIIKSTILQRDLVALDIKITVKEVSSQL